MKRDRQGTTRSCNKKAHGQSELVERVPCARTRKVHKVKEEKRFWGPFWGAQNTSSTCWEQHGYSCFSLSSFFGWEKILYSCQTRASLQELSMEVVSYTKEKGQDQCSLKARDMICPISFTAPHFYSKSVYNKLCR